MKNKGQTSIILILLAAAALIFFAATLNWGRVSQFKTMTTAAATNGASSMVSSIASYGEAQIQSQLQGKFKYCATSSIWGAILKVIIIVGVLVLVVYTGGAAWQIAVAVISAVLATTALVLQLAVVQPGLTALWNKQQAALPLVDQFLEQGLIGTAQGVVTDQAKVADYFDMNTNGKFGPASGDTISRFGFYYTERLRALKKLNPADITFFLDGLRDLQGQLSEGCPDGAASYGNDPHCNPCCVPLNAPGSDPPKRLRPLYCDTSPGICGAPPYEFIYDPSYPKYSGGGSLLAVMGLDAEKRPFQAGDAKGVLFPFLWDMDSIRAAYTLKSIGPGGVKDSRKPDKVDIFDLSFLPGGRFKAADYSTDPATDICAGDPTQSFWWRPGADKFCSTTWPYDQGVGCVESTGTCTPATASQWTADPVDNAVYKLKEFFVWSQELLKQDDAVLSAHLEEWFPEAASWVADCGDSKDPATCVPGGILGQLDGGFTAWRLILTAWLNSDEDDVTTADLLKNYHDRGLFLDIQPQTWPKANAWCVPNDSSGMSPQEADYINNTDTCPGCYSNPGQFKGNAWGSLNSVIACLDWNSTNDVRFKKCKDDIDAITCSGTPLPDECKSLPGDAGTAPSYDACVLTPFANWLSQDTNAVQNRNTGGDPVKEAQKQADLAALGQCQTATGAAQCLPSSTGKPASCDSLPRSLTCDPANGPCVPPPYPANICSPGAATYKTWLNDSATLAGQPNHAAQFAKRSAFLKSMKDNAKVSLGAVAHGKLMLDTFLYTNPDELAADPTYEAPVPNLIKARQNFHLYIEKLPNFLVYGWQSPQDPRDPASAMHWHMVRAEAMVPGKCLTGLCCPAGSAECVAADTSMRVDTHTEGFLGRTRCYELKNYEGRGLVRVTRWDEDRQNSGGAKFNNKVPLWNFRFGRPGASAPSAAGLDACRGLGLVHSTGSYTGADKTTLNNAFMLDLSQPNGLSAPCWSAVDQLLSNGVKSAACAEYRGNGDPNKSHMTVKFVPCPGGAFYDDKTIGN